MSDRSGRLDVDVWVRGTPEATTHRIEGVPPEPSAWTDADVRELLMQMLLTLERAKNPGGEPPPVSLRGFSWIVSPERDGVLVHLDMQIGTASAGPFAIAEPVLSEMIGRVIAGPVASAAVH